MIITVQTMGFWNKFIFSVSQNVCYYRIPFLMPRRIYESLERIPRSCEIPILTFHFPVMTVPLHLVVFLRPLQHQYDFARTFHFARHFWVQHPHSKTSPYLFFMAWAWRQIWMLTSSMGKMLVCSQGLIIKGTIPRVPPFSLWFN